MYSREIDTRPALAEVSAEHMTHMIGACSLPIMAALGLLFLTAEPSGDGRATVKPPVKLVALAVIIIASNAGTRAQTAAPATAIPPGTTQGPWTSVKAGNSGSHCSPGEYAVGIEVEVAPSGTGPCAECISRLRVICRRYGI